MTTPDTMREMPMPVPTGTLIGYARRSTGHQSLDQQHDALQAFGVDPLQVFDDTMSGAREDRPGLAALLAYVRPGDTVVVVSLDRLGRTIAGVFRTIETLAARGIHIRTLRESIDTSTALGRMLMAIFAGIAEYERVLIAERAAVARQSAVDRGKIVGRPRKLSPEDRRALVRLHNTGDGDSIADLQRRFKVSRATVYATLAAGV
jgi:DNA invertase Pin-like site-specific DNA recombinase